MREAKSPCHCKNRTAFVNSGSKRKKALLSVGADCSQPDPGPSEGSNPTGVGVHQNVDEVRELC
jgi:hypothetical protein